MIINNMETKREIITGKQKQLAIYAKVLSHPVRVYIIELLRKQTCCYSGDLALELPLAKSTLSQHLKELKKAGLIQGEIKPPRIKYCLNRNNWEEARTLLKSFLDS
jgi:ArsR family transcriptional regulator, arsenate/arsenite/antimonite-responsive transcriptional repressor